MILLNILFAIVLGHWAKRDFERGYNTAGWVNLFFSAWNAAVVANHFL
jgi:hypothetical protein